MLEKWAVIKEIVILLQIPYNATIAFQYKKLTLSDVFGRWLAMELHLEACTKKLLKTNLAKSLYNATRNRKENIYNNPIMSCALYMDPRFHNEIMKNSDKVAEAKKNMLTIWRRLNVLRSIELITNEQTNTSSDSLTFEFDENAALEKHLMRGQNIIDMHPNFNDSMQNNEPDIELIIDLYDPSPIPLNASILSYWEGAKTENIELYSIAMVVFAVPPTEVQVERDFSGLDCVFTKRRGNLCSSRLEDIFLIYLNPDLYNMVTEKEIDDLYKSLDAEESEIFSSAKKKLDFQE